MYSYRIVFKPYKKTKIFKDPNFMHGFTLLPYDGPREDINLLWTSSRIPRTDNRCLIIQTNDLMNMKPWRYHEDVERVEGPLDLDQLIFKNLKKNSLVKFEITTCPLKQKDGKTIPLFNEDDQIQWLKRKLDGALTLTEDSLLITNMGERVSKVRKVKFSRIMFTGYAIVDNVDLLHQIVEKGVGKGKNFGLGLLQIVPVRR